MVETTSCYRQPGQRSTLSKMRTEQQIPKHLVKLCPELTEQRLANFHTELISDLLPLEWTVAQLSRFLIEINIAELIAVPVEEQHFTD